MKRATLIALFCLTGFAFAQLPAQGQGQNQGSGPPRGEQRGERRGPPQEAFDACKGRKDGDAAEMKTRDGDRRKGTCHLVMIPEGGQGR